MSDPTSLPANNPLSPPPDPSTSRHPCPAAPSTLYKIFFGKDGLRAGWGLLIFIVLMFVSLGGMTAFLKLTHLVPKPNPAQTEIGPTFGFYAEFLPFLITLIVTWIMSKIEKRPNGVYGLGGQRPLSYFFAGLAWGVTCLSLLIFTLWKTGLLVFDAPLAFRHRSAALRPDLALRLSHGRSPRGISHPRLPPLHPHSRPGRNLFHGSSRRRTARRSVFGPLQSFFPSSSVSVTAKIPASLPSGCSPPVSPASFSASASGAPVLSGGPSASTPRGTGHNPFSTASRTADSWSSTIYSPRTPSGKPIMSGGTTGPEGSVFVLPILAIVCLIIIFTLPRTNYGETTTA